MLLGSDFPCSCGPLPHAGPPVNAGTLCGLYSGSLGSLGHLLLGAVLDLGTFPEKGDLMDTSIQPGVGTLALLPACFCK